MSYTISFQGTVEDRGALINALDAAVYEMRPREVLEGMSNAELLVEAVMNLRAGQGNAARELEFGYQLTETPWGIEDVESQKKLVDARVRVDVFNQKKFKQAKIAEVGEEGARQISDEQAIFSMLQTYDQPEEFGFSVMDQGLGGTALGGEVFDANAWIDRVTEAGFELTRVSPRRGILQIEGGTWLDDGPNQVQELGTALLMEVPTWRESFKEVNARVEPWATSEKVVCDITAGDPDTLRAISSIAKERAAVALASKVESSLPAKTLQSVGTPGGGREL